ncbi:MAG: 2-phospho-L-lactate transferase CofD family protein [Desulfococcaceae bacterium]|jgi:2-phospho-L-lactate transferase/gluconeogenesis factor (CofD/UPF0052 family)/GTP:adenosylcobinamide-phosphate guanylyltransferase/hydroxymethylpyrimidine pyrophosphatase-like HAD family hydrolase|nr:2-phospho-L-lactate transferase CofD family protein [Desulfococcaceae bacterium]
MEAKKIAVFGGGSGAQSLLEKLKTNPENFITVIINAYDNGKSTGKVREDFRTLGPSDSRKNLVHLLDDRNPDARHIRNFFSLRLEDRDRKNAGKILRAIAENDIKTIGKCGAKWNVYSRMPLEFRDTVSLGMRNYPGEIRKNGKKPDYSDFNIMNAVFAGIMGKKGCLQRATDLISDAMPLRGKVLLNSLQNLHLYAVRKSGNHHYGMIQDEAAIVSQAVPGRIEELFLLESPLHPDETDSFSSLSPEEIKEKLRSRSVSPCLNPKVRDALKDADIIIYAPGTPHSSLYPTYMTSGLADCIAGNTRAEKIFLCNIREDKDICGYSAPELFNTALSYLHRSSTAHFSASLLADYVFVNTPSLLHRSYISSDIEYFRRSPEFQVMAENEFLQEKYKGKEGKIRIVHTDMEDAVNRGKHNSHKLMSFVSHIPGMSGPEILNTRNILAQGAILFDVDQTLLDVRIDPVAHQKYEESLLESPALGLIAELLEKGFRLCAITGNDLEKFHRRFIHILTDRLKKENRIHLMQRFEVYGNGAATHMTFDAYGNFHPNEIYNRSFQMPESELQIIRKALSDIIREVQQALLADREAFEKEYDPDKWIYPYNEADGTWSAEENGKSKILPWIEIRGNGSMITLKPLPSRKHIRNPNRKSIRRIVFEMIKDRLKSLLGERFERFMITTGGWSSIDITLRVTKAVAVKHYLDCHGLCPEEVIYFGNEFSKYGNDQPVLDKIGNIHVFSVNQPEEEIFFHSRVFFGGRRGVLSTTFQFGTLLELYAKAEAEKAYMQRPEDVTPVIQQMILKNYADKIAHREKLIRQTASRKEQMHHYRSVIQVMNSTIRLLRHKPVLIIPAAGKGSRLNADVPKPLYPVAGKPAIVHVLDLFSDFTEQIIILINPSHRQAFEQVLKKREERIVLVDHDIQTGEGRAVRDALPHAGGDCRDVIVAWADLIKGNREKIQKTLEMHYESGSSMTFPTMWEPNPYVAILRDEQDRVCRAAFRQYGEIHLRGEHDCSFFVINRNRLEQAADALHTQYFHADAGTYDFRDFGIPEPYGTEFKFLYLLQYLYEEGSPAAALPICKRNEFLGFNTKEEAGLIEAEYEFVPEGRVAMRQAV